MSVRVYTVALSQWRKAMKMGVELIDITVKSGDRLYAPYENVLWAYKRSEVSEEEYTTIYLDKMEKVLIESPEAIETLLEREDTVALACYCKAGSFCHRHILLEFLKDVAEDNGIDFEYLGEIT